MWQTKWFWCQVPFLIRPTPGLLPLSIICDHTRLPRTRGLDSPWLRRFDPAPIAVRVAQHFHHPESAPIRRLLKLLPCLHSAHLRVQHPSLVQFLAVQLPREIVAVQLAHKHPSAFIPATPPTATR